MWNSEAVHSAALHIRSMKNSQKHMAKARRAVAAAV